MTNPYTPIALRFPWDAANPYPYYEMRRREGAVFWDDAIGAWMILGYHAARQVLASPGWTSNPLASPNAPTTLRAAGPDVLRRNILFVDGDDHQRLRNAVRNVFTRSFVAGLRDGIEALAVDTIDSISTGEEFDFMSEVALPLPIAVATAWLGLDIDAAQVLRDESPAISRMLSDPNDPATTEAGMAAFATLLTEFLPLAADRRGHPGDDLLSYMATDSALELDDVISTAIVIAIAGHETTANFLGASMIRLFTPRSDGARLIDSVHSVGDALITELLRLDGPAQAVIRTATDTHVVGGITIRAGEAALVVLAAANRDPAAYTDPAQFLANRAGPPPLAFGHGAHYCLGMALARLETAVALEHLLLRQPALGGTSIWRDNAAIRGPQTVPVVFQAPET